MKIFEIKNLMVIKKYMIIYQFKIHQFHLDRFILFISFHLFNLFVFHQIV